MIYKRLFFLLFVKPLALIVIGLNIRHRDLLPEDGPAIIVANHNSHLDTLVLMSLFPLSILDKVRPVAASDHFMKPTLVGWIARNLIDILPLERVAKETIDERFETIYKSLENSEIVIIFPEGSRGEAEQFSRFKKGIALLSDRCPDAPVTPVFLQGLGKCLPKGEGMFVPFICDVVVGEAMCRQGDAQGFVSKLEQKVHDLAKDITSTPWV